MKRVAVEIDGDVLEYNVAGDVGFGEDRVLLDEDDDLTARAPWRDQGYAVERFLDPDDFQQLHDGMRALITGMVDDALPPHVDFPLERYHERVPDDVAHAAVVARGLAGIPLTRLPIDVARIERRISEIVGIDVTTHNPGLPPEEEQYFAVRIVRPMRGDNNPPHRDVWIDALRNGINLYVPLCGSNERSSLPLLPGSHRWPEAAIERTLTGARVSGNQYHVPAVTGAAQPLRMIRPNPGWNEVLVFSPYLIHGGGRNFATDTTRISLEMRLFRA